MARCGLEAPIPPPVLPTAQGIASRAGPLPPVGSAPARPHPNLSTAFRSSSDPPPALPGLPSPFPQADTARGWAPTGSRGSIPAASRLSGAADCGRIRRHCLPRPHPQSSAARRLRNSTAQGTGNREPGAGSRNPGDGRREPGTGSRAESREPDPRESGVSRPRQFSRPPQISPPAANQRNCSKRSDGPGASLPRPGRTAF